MLKIALLGKGKTGSKIIELNDNNPKYSITVFDSQNRPTVEKLKQHDYIISFLPGPIFSEYLDMLLESRVCVISGTTGCELPNGLNERLKEINSSWVLSSNFAVGMSLAYHVLKVLKSANVLFDDYSLNIHEIHHTKKIDAPSGTAKSWNDWLGGQCEVTSERIGDVVGTHTVTLETPYEEMTFTHKSKDRKIFAEGALWCVEYLQSTQLPAGVHLFENLTRSIVEKELLK
ncbi:MAG: hypothetical protein H6622_14160 [Halobacteriovoraceae bacterium]|nr:hypothetical protein [Halobacteriovoraceae bacterium]